MRMKVDVTFKKFDLSQEDKVMIEDSLNSLEKFFSKISDEATSAHVLLYRMVHADHKDKLSIKVVVSIGKSDFRAENMSYTIKDGMLAICEKLKKQFDHFKVRHSGVKRQRLNAAFLDHLEDVSFDLDSDNLPNITKRKVFSNLIPMSEEEAIATMENLKHGFFLFVNEDSNQYNMVYKRPNDPGYGIIELLTSGGVL